MTESNTKARVLFLEHYLNDHTDEQHMLTADELMEIYELNGYKANRNTIRDDIATLLEAGVDVITDQKGKYKAFYIGMRLFCRAQNADRRCLKLKVYYSRQKRSTHREALPACKRALP